MHEINVTPFVDVMLVLLIVFMVTAPLLTVGVPIELPETRANPIQGDSEPLTVSVAPVGMIYLQETEIDLDTLAPKLIAIAKEGYDQRIFVRGDRSVGYGDVMRVMGVLNQAGFRRNALETETVPVGEQ
ncbi:MAG TPA: biopolymer transporter ExbD [Hyphomicrobiales bacterium]|nr:biopolymer transporter ExbD [Hyphomicrobiales bacterium]